MLIRLSYVHILPIYIYLIAFYVFIWSTQVKELRKIVGDDIELCIAGNKCDLEKQRQVPEDEAEAYAVSVNATHYKVRVGVTVGK
jgi:hypothetical protein